MSVKLMSDIFETEFRDLPVSDKLVNGKPRMAKASTLKIVLLAIADHANDEGESAYPGYTKLELKTGLSRQGLADTLSALRYNGIIAVSDKPSKLGTNSYSINTSAFPSRHDGEDNRLLVKPLDESSHLTSTSQVTLLEVVKPLDLNHTLTTIKPSIKNSADKPRTPPEVKLFREVTNRYPNKINFQDVTLIIQSVSKRLGRECVTDDLRPFYAAWCAKGFKPTNLAWLSWAESGVIPNGPKPRNDIEALRAMDLDNYAE